MAKSENKKTDDAAVTTADGSAESPRPPTVTNDDIARHAYNLYLARGREQGHDVDDWLQAERELHSDPEC